MLVGRTKSTRSEPAWKQAYRALEHRQAKDQCSRLPKLKKKFPPEIRDFGEIFVEMQNERHLADYDPTVVFNRAEVLQRIEETENAIRRFEKAARKDRRAFAILVLLKFRK